jgi:hypothetical protein
LANDHVFKFFRRNQSAWRTESFSELLKLRQRESTPILRAGQV